MLGGGTVWRSSVVGGGGKGVQIPGGPIIDGMQILDGLHIPKKVGLALKHNDGDVSKTVSFM